MIVFATNNAHKLDEVRQMLGGSIEVKSLKDIGCEADIPETADTFEGNAWQKARYVKEHFGYDCMADDSGLEVDALGGEPGVRSARYAATADGQGHDSEANMDLLLSKMQNITDRSARFRTALALIYKGEERLFNGTVEGRILTERHGVGGFGYDPIFQPEGYDISFAEMTPEQKNAISHRGRAIQQLVRALLTVCAILLIPFHASSQALNTWKVYPSYNVCTKNVPAGNRVYALMESKLMAYDTEDTSIKAWDKTNGLSDVAITDIAYCEAAKRIIIVYDNSNIDLLSTEDDDYIVNLAQLKNSSLQGKEINSVSVQGTMAYVATGFGVVVIDVENAVIRNTYRLGTNVTACVASDDAIYAGTSTGILKGLMSKNLQDKSTWTQISSELKPIKMAYFDGRVWVVVKGNFYYSDPEGTTFTSSIAIQPQYIAVEDNCMIAGTTASFLLYTSATARAYAPTPDKWTDVHRSKGKLWVSGGANGLQAYTLEGQTFTQVLTGIKLNSPMHDYSYHLRFAGGRLLVAGGSYNYSVSSLTGTAMIYEPDHTWTNFDSESVAAVATHRYKDVTDIEQDPNDYSHHFVGTARSGLYEFRDAKCVAHYGVTNSPLVSILPNNNTPDNYVVANGVRYDADGNLWVLNPSTGVNDTIIRIMQPNGSWAGLQYDELNGISNLDNLLFDSRGWAWMSSLRMSGRGIFCLDYNGTPTQRSDDRHMLRTTITNQDGTVYQPDQFYCVAEDIDGSVWIGTNEGPFRISSPDNFFSTDFTFEQVKISRNDGSGLADYLLSSIPVRAITVDGAGRKWFGTMSNGVYLISADCQEQIYHFTTDNTPLPSNDIDDIAINGSTGEVFFATAKGLCSFVADATDPVADISDDELFVFPNPVTPDYSGPIAVRGLTQGSEVKIVAPSGQIIYSGYSQGGTFTWNGGNQRGSRVASGVYLIIASNADGSKAASTKVAVIR